MSDNQQSPQDRAERALAAGVPEIYVNGFLNSIAAGDVFTVLERNGRPVAILNMSFTVAKTLGISLNAVVSQFEDITGRTMLTTHEVENAMKDHHESGGQK